MTHGLIKRKARVFCLYKNALFFAEFVLLCCYDIIACDACDNEIVSFVFGSLLITYHHVILFGSW